ncbi:MAG TPA: LruC domain-containing protein, partial [bacterium]|nr:LruC domain-containing protein [bacterium]
ISFIWIILDSTGFTFIKKDTELIFYSIISGTFTIQLIVDDGNTVSLSCTKQIVIIDNVAPNHTLLISPKNIGINTNNFEYIWQTATDTGSGINYYLLEISSDTLFSDTNIVCTYIISGNTNAVNTNQFNDGTYYWRLKIFDNNGNSTLNYDTGNFYIDFISPTAIINSEALLGMFSGEKRIFSAVNSFDSDGNIDSYIWSAASTPDSFVYSETFIYIPSFTGMDTITLKVIDNYGYYSETMVVVNIRKPNADIEVKVSGVRPEQHYYTLAFEDLYPNVGDGDYNDFVCDYNVERILNSNNQITQIKLSSKALARGAGYTHKFKVKLKINGSANIIVNEYKQDGS